MTKLNWVKCTNGNWCNLNTVNLSNVTVWGVYIIWHTGNPSKVVYVGQGDVAERLKAHRTNVAIQAYSSQGLRVTWASVAAGHRDGIERYLADTWKPLVGDTHPNVAPTKVNSPWT